MKIISTFLALFCFQLVGAQPSCEIAELLVENEFRIGNTDSVYWLKFKAKGNKLNLKIFHLNSDTALNYSLFLDASCASIQQGVVFPLRATKSGIWSDEKWQLLVDKGYCLCDQCFKKISFPNKDWLSVTQDQVYLLKVESKKQGFRIQLNYSEIENRKKEFTLNSKSTDLLVGMKYEIRDVHFKESSMEYTVPNPPELNELLLFMNNNPQVKIEIQGHVNGPFNSDPELFIQKSLERAEKIKSFLTAKGISPARINTKGLGNTQMRFPKPKTPQESEQNRRIEVEIIGI